MCVVVRWQTTDTRNARTRTHTRAHVSRSQMGEPAGVDDADWLQGGGVRRGRPEVEGLRGWAAAAREVVGMGMEVGGNNGVLQLVHD